MFLLFSIIELSWSIFYAYPIVFLFYMHLWLWRYIFPKYRLGPVSGVCMVTRMCFDTIIWHCIVIVTAHGPCRHLFPFWHGIAMLSLSWSGMLLCCVVNDNLGGGSQWGWWLWAVLARCQKTWLKEEDGLSIVGAPSVLGVQTRPHVQRSKTSCNQYLIGPWLVTKYSQNQATSNHSHLKQGQVVCHL